MRGHTMSMNRRHRAVHQQSVATFLLLFFFLYLFIFLHLACPHCSSHPPSFPRLCPFRIFIPPSVCQTLDSSNSLLICGSLAKRQSFSFFSHFRFQYLTHLSFLLLLAGDIHSNPGPLTIQFAHLNTCSISAVTLPLTNLPSCKNLFLIRALKSSPCPKPGSPKTLYLPL